MEEIKQHCEKVIQMLRLDYPAQLQYPGSKKKYMMLCCRSYLAMNFLMLTG